MNRSKDIGTRAESAIVKWAHSNGYPHAHRKTLSGAMDLGDVELTRHVVLQIKAGHAAERASDAQIAVWLGDAAEQAERGGYTVGFLVTKRAGHGRPGSWWVHTRIQEEVPIRFTLTHLPVFVTALTPVI